jgi:AcrR family transcriptional regulator
MNIQSMSRNYESPLRAEQAGATRERILQALSEIFERDPEIAFSVDDLAREAGVNRRTVFRHFQDKDALLDAFWARANEKLGVRVWPENELDLAAIPPELFAALDRHEGIVRASNVSVAGREVRLRANDQRQAAFRKSLEAVSEQLSPERRKQLEALVHLLFSPAAWQTMRDHWGLTGREAGEASAWAIQALLTAARKGDDG